MNTVQIIRSLRDVGSFLCVFPSDLLHSITHSSTVIINGDPHTEKCLHWLAVHFRPRSYTSYFDSYGLPPFIPAIQFIRRNFSAWNYNSVQLQRPTSTVCGKY
jgi:Adenovirus endoprotease.